jgi:molybdenum cofactor synthesis domain-containing protein
MCDSGYEKRGSGTKTIPVQESVGTILAHDITEIRPGDFKDRAFKKGHLIREEDVCHLQRLGKEHLFVLHVAADEMHENDAAYALANALMGEGVEITGEPKEGKISIVAAQDGLLTIDVQALHDFNMLGEVMCATLHTHTVVKKGQVVAATRAIPLVVKKSIVEKAVEIAECGMRNADFKSEIRNRKSEIGKASVIEVKELRKPRAGVVITGNEVYHGRIKDAFAPVITKKIEEVGGEIVGIYYAPDDKTFIEDRLRELINAGADLLITTGGMSVDPDDVTRFAIKNLGATDFTYGSAVLPGAMFLVGYINPVQSSEFKVQSEENSKLETRNSERIPILGIPACGMYHKITILDLVLPRVLAGEKIGRRELADLGHGGLCLNCKECRYPVCPFGKAG